jgi:hypothetical protein
MISIFTEMSHTKSEGTGINQHIFELARVGLFDVPKIHISIISWRSA